MVSKAPRLWQTSFNLYQWLMIVVHGYRATAVVLSLLLNIVVQTDYQTAVTAEMVRTNVNSVDQSSKPLDVDLPPTLPMTFGTENSTRVSAQSGSTALLPCVVRNIGDGTVSWIKRKDVHQLLTVSLTTYASDERYQAIHFHHSEDWSLQIKYVQRRDGGMYECQVSTHPPASIFLFLAVVEARAEIAGMSEKFVRPDSTLQLNCRVKNSTETPSYIFWYHNRRMINYDVEHGVNVSTDLVARESWLEVPKAGFRHSGNYTCESSNAQSAHAYVHVFDGENPAAMQHSNNANSVIHGSFVVKTTTILIAMIIALSSLIMSTTLTTETTTTSNTTYNTTTTTTVTKTSAATAMITTTSTASATKLKLILDCTVSSHPTLC